MELQVIQNKIYEIRGQRVMLDFDLAELYSTETKRLKEAVRRNMERFEGNDLKDDGRETFNERMLKVLKPKILKGENKRDGYGLKNYLNITEKPRCRGFQRLYNLPPSLIRIDTKIVYF
jgi:hypothetical protein